MGRGAAEKGKVGAGKVGGTPAVGQRNENKPRA